jgi:glycosyltransferase involved in cell wall biosynthesis
MGSRTNDCGEFELAFRHDFVLMKRSMTNPKIELSIVMPCLNEGETLEACILKAQKALKDANIAGEVIVADNGSTDNSLEIAQRLGARIINVTAKGYGNALMGGISAAYGKYVLMGDADDSYDLPNCGKVMIWCRAAGCPPAAVP